MTLIKYIDTFLTNITLTVRKIRNCIGIKKKDSNIINELHDIRNTDTKSNNTKVKL
jgi:hypothetical protein